MNRHICRLPHGVSPEKERNKKKVQRNPNSEPQQQCGHGPRPFRNPSLSETLTTRRAKVSCLLTAFDAALQNEAAHRGG
jgi:hypothetical protein